MATTNTFGSLSTLRTAIVAEFNKLRALAVSLRAKLVASAADVTAIRTQLVALGADVTALRTAYEAHVHDGITAGAASSAVRTAAGAAPALTYVDPAAITYAAPVADTSQDLSHTA